MQKYTVNAANFHPVPEAYIGGWYKADDVNAEIARLTAERDEARAQMAAILSRLAEDMDNGWSYIAGNHVRALTPADATAALAARDAAMRNEGRRQAAEIARDDAKSETGVILNRRLAGIGVPVAASARRRQAVRTAHRILAALEPEEKA